MDFQNSSQNIKRENASKSIMLNLARSLEKLLPRRNLQKISKTLRGTFKIQRLKNIHTFRLSMLLEN